MNVGYEGTEEKSGDRCAGNWVERSSRSRKVLLTPRPLLLVPERYVMTGGSVSGRPQAVVAASPLPRVVRQRRYFEDIHTIFTMKYSKMGAYESETGQEGRTNTA